MVGQLEILPPRPNALKVLDQGFPLFETVIVVSVPPEVEHAVEVFETESTPGYFAPEESLVLVTDPDAEVVKLSAELPVVDDAHIVAIQDVERVEEVELLPHVDPLYLLLPPHQQLVENGQTFHQHLPPLRSLLLMEIVIVRLFLACASQGLLKGFDNADVRSRKLPQLVLVLLVPWMIPRPVESEVPGGGDVNVLVFRFLSELPGWRFPCREVLLRKVVRGVVMVVLGEAMIHFGPLHLDAPPDFAKVLRGFVAKKSVLLAHTESCFSLDRCVASDNTHSHAFGCMLVVETSCNFCVGGHYGN